MADDEIEEITDDTTCNICYAEFLDPDDLSLHISQVHAEKYHRPCQFCAAVFPDLETYVLHIRDSHLTSIKCCKYCTKAFTDLDVLRKHENKHCSQQKKSIYSCSQCSKLFNNIFDLERHEYNKHNNERDGVILHDYYAMLSSVLNIKASTFLQSLGTSTIYICVKCEMTTQLVSEYIKHLQTYKCECTVCDKCSNVYKDRKGIARHVAVSKACQGYVTAADRLKQCPKCHKNIDALLLTEHMKYCKPAMCTVCNIPFMSIQELSEHQTQKHPLAISLKTCNFCRREFIGTVALQNHIDRSHKADFHLYKYACIYCSETYFKHPKDLFGHFFSTHKDLQPFSCKICDKSFRVRKKFTIHIKLDHKSVGFVEFDDKYHVFFTDKKSEHPFQPTSLLIDNSNVENVEESENQTEDEVQQTDKETDAEVNTKHEMSDNDRKPLKLRFKQRNKAGVNLINMNSDFMSATETEGNQTEIDSKSALAKLKLKRKSKTVNTKPSKLSKKNVSETENEVLEESDDEPLLVVKKREKKKRATIIQNWNSRKKNVPKPKFNKKEFTCKQCKKYCYTYQNYNHHMSLHGKNDVKKCIKCSKEFRSKTALNKHVESQHASSKLTETLKNLLERRKKGGSYVEPQLTMTEKFLRTIKKVKEPSITSTATLTEVNEKLSVQKFIENFTPESNETAKKEPNEFDAVVSIKTLRHAIRKPPVIKMKKFIPKPISTNIRLAMPVRYKQTVSEPQNITIRIVHKPTVDTTNYNNEHTYDNNYQEETFIDYEEEIDPNQDKNETVPEVAEEVLLGESEEPRTIVIPHKIVIPKLPKGFKQIKQMSVAHLQSEAPFFKIIKVDTGLETEKESKKKRREKSDNDDIEDVKLPPGTKLVNVNPLAHLLGDTPIEKVVGEQKKNYYKPKTSNFEKAIAKALLKLENPPPLPKKKSKRTSLEVEQ